MRHKDVKMSPPPPLNQVKRYSQSMKVTLGDGTDLKTL